MGFWKSSSSENTSAASTATKKGFWSKVSSGVGGVVHAAGSLAMKAVPTFALGYAGMSLVSDTWKDAMTNGIDGFDDAAGTLSKTALSGGLMLSAFNTATKGWKSGVKTILYSAGGTAAAYGLGQVAEGVIASGESSMVSDYAAIALGAGGGVMTLYNGFTKGFGSAIKTGIATAGGVGLAKLMGVLGDGAEGLIVEEEPVVESLDELQKKREEAISEMMDVPVSEQAQMIEAYKNGAGSDQEDRDMGG